VVLVAIVEFVIDVLMLDYFLFDLYGDDSSSEIEIMDVNSNVSSGMKLRERAGSPFEGKDVIPGFSDSTGSYDKIFITFFPYMIHSFIQSFLEVILFYEQFGSIVITLFTFLSIWL
jgi:hypothetical protein